MKCHLNKLQQKYPWMMPIGTHNILPTKSHCNIMFYIFVLFMCVSVSVLQMVHSLSVCVCVCFITTVCLSTFLLCYDHVVLWRNVCKQNRTVCVLCGEKYIIKRCVLDEITLEFSLMIRSEDRKCTYANTNK